MRSFAFICLSLASHCLLASTQINQGLVGYWPLNEDALDYSGNGYHGTLLEGAHFVDNPNGEGRVLQNVRGEKNYGHVLVDLPASVHTSQSFEIGFKTSGAFWVQFDDRLPLTDAPGWQGIISKPPGMLYISRNLGANRINPMVKSQEQGHHSTINYWPKTPNNSLSQEGVWYHVAWTFHSHNAGDPEGHFRWYINGEKVLDDNGGIQTLLASSSVDFRIGANWSKTANNTKISQMRLYNRILSADEVKLLADTPAGQNISSAELHVEGGMAIEENLSVAGSIHLGDYKTTVNSLFISEPGQLRYKDGDFEGYDGNEWKSLTGINDNQLTTEGIIESTSGGFKLPDGTVIDSADDLGNASNLQDGSGNAVVQVTNDGNLELSTPLNHDDSLTTSHNLVLNNHALIASHAGNPAAGNVDYMHHVDTNDGNQKGVWKFFSDSTLTATQPNSLIEAGAIKLNGIQDSLALNVNGDAKIEGTMSLKNTTLEPLYVKAGEYQVGYRKIIYRGQSITFQPKVGPSNNRGLGVVIIDRISGEIDSAYNYDVYGGGSEVQNALANDLSLVDSSKVVIVASNDAWRYNDAIKAQLHRIGASNIFEKFGPSPGRRSYALIGIPGLGLASGLEAFSETSQSLPMAELATVLMQFNNQEISIGGLNQQSQFMLNQLTTAGTIESTSGGFKLPDGTVINSEDVLRGRFVSTLDLSTETTGFTSELYYPVLFNLAHSKHSDKPTHELTVFRSDVHRDNSWAGSLIANFKFHPNRYGNGSNFANAFIKQKNHAFVGNYIPSNTNGNGIIVWLKGGFTYDYWSTERISRAC